MLTQLKLGLRPPICTHSFSYNETTSAWHATQSTVPEASTKAAGAIRPESYRLAATAATHGIVPQSATSNAEPYRNRNEPLGADYQLDPPLVYDGFARTWHRDDTSESTSPVGSIGPPSGLESHEPCSIYPDASNRIEAITDAINGSGQSAATPKCHARTSPATPVKQVGITLAK